MHSAAITIHIAFTGSPRFSAMMPSATAPSTATATHSNFLGINMVRSYGSCARPQPPIPRLSAEALKPLCFDPPSATGETLARNLSPRHSGNRGGVRALGLTGLARGGQFPGVGGAPVRGGLQDASVVDDRKPRSEGCFLANVPRCGSDQLEPQQDLVVSLTFTSCATCSPLLDSMNRMH